MEHCQYDAKMFSRHWDSCPEAGVLVQCLELNLINNVFGFTPNTFTTASNLIFCASYVLSRHHPIQPSIGLE